MSLRKFLCVLCDVDLPFSVRGQCRRVHVEIALFIARSDVFEVEIFTLHY